MTDGEERGGGYLGLVQETGRRWVPDTGVNVNRVLMVRSVQEVEREACTGGVFCLEVERRGLYRSWRRRPVQEVEREACTGGVSCQEVKRRGLYRRW
jgi:hypothetical protein